MACSTKPVKKPETVFDYHHLSHYFEYYPEEGRVYHKEIGEESLPKCSKFGLRHWNRKAGKPADKAVYKMGNTEYNKCYHTSEVGKGIFLAHRLAWLLYYGAWPEGAIDHLDGVGVNNKIVNLRDCKDTTHNNRNVAVDKNRRYPRGVRFTLSGDAKTPTFKAWYEEGKRQYQLYCGRDYLEACCARKSWENKILRNPESGYTLRHFGRE